MMHIRFERNTGCRVEDAWTYKGMRALVLQNEKLRMSILLDKGSDIFELLYKPLDLDFLYRSSKGIQNPVSFSSIRPGAETAFLDHYYGGWQEVFPAGSGGCEYKGALFGLHGEVFLQPWDYEILKDTPDEVTVRLFVRTIRSPYLLIKEITLKQGEQFIRFKQQVTNEGDVPLEFMWGQHPAFGPPFLGPETRLDLPACTILTHPVRYSENSRFPTDAAFTWPYAQDRTGREVDLRYLLRHSDRCADMLYATKLEEGWAALTNTAFGVGIGLTWDVATFPYLWIWNEAGGTLSYPWYGRGTALALEPFTSLPGSGDGGLLQAINNQTAVSIEPGEAIQTEFAVVIYETASPVKRITSVGVIADE